MARWHPWRALSERPWIRLIFAPLPKHVGRGALVQVGDERTIILDPSLRQRDRNAVLGHELVHDERDILFTPATPRALVVKEEAAVNRITTRRLVPLDELEDLVARVVSMGEGVTCVDVEEEFEVPREVAVLALWLLAQTPGAWS
jgi:hypothetical protein